MEFFEALRKLLEWRKTIIFLAISSIVVPELIRYFRKKRRVTYEDIIANEQVTGSQSAVRSESGSHCIYCHCQGRPLISTRNSMVPEIQAVSCSSLMHGGMQSLIKAIHLWERACELAEQADRAEDGSPQSLAVQLKELLQVSYRLCDSVSHVLIFCPTLSISGVGVVGAESGNSLSTAIDEPENTMSVFSDESYFSAPEEFVGARETEPLVESGRDASTRYMLLYHEALAHVEMGDVVCRKPRTEAVNCSSDEEFLAKLYCIRKAMKMLFEDHGKREWVARSIRDLLCFMLRQANTDVESFCSAYDRLIAFCMDSDNERRIASELKERKVPTLSFYDVVSDFIVLDAVDEMTHPPGAIAAVVRNPIIPGSTKERVLASIATSVITSKRSRLAVRDGFLKQFYDVMETVAPMFAWSLLGSDDQLGELFGCFKDHVVAFHVDIFNEEVVRFTNVGELAEDIWTAFQRHLGNASSEMTRRNPVLGNSFTMSLQNAA